MRSRSVAAAIALLAVGLLGSTSAAAAKPDLVGTSETSRFSSSTVIYSAAPGRVRSEVAMTGDGTDGASMLIESSRRLEAAPGCELQDPRTAICAARRIPFTGVEVSLWGGDDSLTVRRSRLAFLVSGSRGDDALEGSAGPGNLIFGDAGRDRLLAGGDGLFGGGRGADVIRGSARDDTLIGGPGRDRITGGRGSDSIRAGFGADQARGGGGTDDISGGRGADLLRGGISGDEIAGGLGRDRARGGRGADSIDLARRDRDRRADCGPGPDEIRLDSRALDPAPRHCRKVFRLER